MRWDDSYDFISIGSGGGGMCAALAAQDRGRSALILEKLDRVGGSTALSGGVLWIPANPLMQRAGRADSPEQARTYLENVFAGYSSQGASSQRVDAYLDTGPAVVRFLESKGMQFHLCKFWPDYYDHLPGGNHESRSLMATMFDLRELGEWEGKLNIYPKFDIPMHPDALHDLGLVRRTWRGKRAALALAWRILRDKLAGSRVRGNGAALQGRMLQILIRERVPIWTGTHVEDLVWEQDRVIGVVARKDGKRLHIQANEGVLLASGGFARNREMRERYQRHPVGNTWTNASEGDTGELLELVKDRGAATENLDLSIWVATSGMPNGDPAPGSVLDGKVLPYMHSSAEMGKPHCILVDSRGRRFVNESGSYMAVGEAMYEEARSPCWYILSHEHRKRYMWGMAFGLPREWLTSGYVKRSDSIEGLAKQCGIDSQGLMATVERFNEFARSGNDLDFHRGENSYDAWSGDESNAPNPALGAIDSPPFYAVAAFPGDVGTAGGLVCDENARVLREDGSVIKGLYAAGNCTSSPLGRFYPGAGGSIGSSFIFGYRAALHAAEADFVGEEK